MTRQERAIIEALLVEIFINSDRATQVKLQNAADFLLAQQKRQEAQK